MWQHIVLIVKLYISILRLSTFFLCFKQHHCFFLFKKKTFNKNILLNDRIGLVFVSLKIIIIKHNIDKCYLFLLQK